jgi:hypothetical protein
VRSKVEHVFAGNVLLKLLPAKMSQR